MCEEKRMLCTVNGNTGYFNTGCSNLGNCNSGNCNLGDYNSGDYNSGHCNSNDCNSGSRNSGYYNSGNCNSGYYNSGHCNSGNFNSGYHNSGMFNSCSYSSGVFCNIEPKISIFNIQTNMTMRNFLNSKYYTAICSSKFDLTKWDNDKLTEIPYKEACRKWWGNMTRYNREIIKSMPNFDIDVFCKITGIDRKDV